MAEPLPKALQPDWWDKMTAPGTVGGMFADIGRNVTKATEAVSTPAAAPVAAAPMVATTTPAATSQTATPTQQQATTTANPQTTSTPKTEPMAIPMAEHSQTTSGQVVHDKAAVKKIESAQANVEASVLEGAKVGAAKAAEIAAIRDASIEHQKQLDAEAAAAELEEKAQVDNAVGEQRKMLDDLGAQKKDPEKLWKEKGFFAQAMAGVGVALGSLGSGLTGGPNHALNIVNSAIEHSLDAQEQEIQLKRDKVNLQNNLIAQLRQSGLDGRSVRSLARQHLLEQTAQTIEAKAAGAPAEIMQNAMITVNQLREKAAKEADERKQITVQNVKAKAPAYTPMDLQKMGEEERKRFVPDAGALANSEAQAAKMNDYAAAHNSVVGDIQALKTLVDKHGNETLPTQAKAKMIQLKNRIVTAMNKEAGLGAMSGSDRELIEGQIADPTAFFARGVKTSERLQDLINTFGRAKLNTYKAYGLVAQ